MPVTLAQLTLDLRPHRGWIPAFGLLAAIGVAGAVTGVLATSPLGVALGAVTTTVGVAYAHAAATARLVLRAGTLTRTSRRPRTVRVDQLARVAEWRGRFGEPHLALTDRDGTVLAFGSWFWRGAVRLQAILGVALAEQPEVVVTNRLANRLDDLACALYQ